MGSRRRTREKQEGADGRRQCRTEQEESTKDSGVPVTLNTGKKTLLSGAQLLLQGCCNTAFAWQERTLGYGPQGEEPRAKYGKHQNSKKSLCAGICAIQSWCIIPRTPVDQVSQINPANLASALRYHTGSGKRNAHW